MLDFYTIYNSKERKQKTWWPVRKPIELAWVGMVIVGVREGTGSSNLNETEQ